MQKQFSIIIPDELYIEQYTTNTYATFEYNGPEKLYAEVQLDGFVYGTVPEGTTFPEQSLKKVVEIDADTYPSAAYYLHTFADEHTYVYEDVVNHDGTIYKKPTNPRLQDIYKLQYNEGAFNSRPDGLNSGPWSFEIIKKATEFIEEQQVKDLLEQVKKVLGNIALDDATQAAYDSYVQACNTYLTTVEPLYPWKYVELTSPTPPKLPLLVIRAMADVSVVLGA